MSLTYSGAEPQPSLAWQFESSNVDYVTNLQPSAQVSPGPAQLQGGASLVTNAPSGSNTAVSFNGTTGSYMNLGTSPVNVDITTSNIFVECWVYLNNQSLSYPVMITVGPTGGQWRWALSFNTTTLNPRLGMNSNGNNLNSSITIAGVQTWSHVAFSFNRTSAGAGTGYLFVNGQLGGSMAVTGLIYSAADTVCIAGYTNISGNLDGYIRDLRVVQGGVVPTTNFTPLASAPFSYASPTYVANMGTTVFTLLGQFITYPPGKYNQAISILNYPVGTPNTGTKYVTYNNPLTLSATVGTSMSVWVNISQLPAVGQKSIVCSIINGTTGQLWIEFNTTGSQTVMYNSTAYFGAVYGVTPSISTWYHYTAVCTSTTLSFYVNGVLASSSAITGPPSFAGGYISIGGSGGYAPFSGLVDDLRIYNTALTAAQIQSVYSSQGAPAPSRAMPQPSLEWQFESSNVDSITGLAPNLSTTGTYAAPTGGTITTVGANRVHSFTTTGTTSITFLVPVTAQILVVAGGGGGGANNTSSLAGGGGGAGEFYTSSSFSVDAGTYTVTVGAAGAASAAAGQSGGDGGVSVFGSISANGGGGGGGGGAAGTNGNGRTGGSGGGAGRSSLTRSGGTSFKTAGGLGNAGGATVNTATFSAAGGGGSAGAGSAGSASGTTPRPGGAGTTNSIRTGLAVTYAAGGTGGARSGTYTPSAGTTNTGNGGDGAPGGSGVLVNGGVGGSGIVVISYNAAIYPAPTYVTGIYGQAISFNNTLSPAGADPNCYVTYDVSSFGISSNSTTMSLWLKSGLTYPVTAGTNPFYVNLQGVSYNGLFTPSATSTISFRKGTSPATTIGSVTAQPGVWQHHCMVFSNVGAVGTSNTFSSYYVNGSFIATANNTIQGFTTLNLGCENSGSNGALCSIDDLRLFNTALTAAQVQSIYIAQGMPGRGAVVSNSRQIYVAPVGTYPTYTPTSGAQFPVFNTSNVSFYSSGGTSGGTVGQYLAFGSQTFNMARGFSAVCQFAWTNGIGVWERIFDFGNGAGNNNILLTRTFSSTNLLFSYRIGSTEYSVTAVGSIAAQNTLYTVVAVYDPSKPLLSLYVNGTLTSSIPAIVTLDTRTLTQTYVGRSNWTSDAYSNVNINYLSIYNRVLTPDEIATPLPTPQITLKGTPLFNQLSPAARSSAVGAFSLRAVNGTSARAVQVRPVAEFPPGVFTETSTVISALSYSQYLTGYPFGGTGVYTSNSSSGTGGSTRSWRAFDGVIGSSGSRWVSDNTYVANTPYSGAASTISVGVTYPGEWLQIQLPQAIVLSSYSIYPQSTNIPATWNVFASNDGTTWTVIDQRGTAPTTGQYNNYTISGSPAAYSYYRIGCYIISLNVSFAIVEMKLYGAPPNTATDFYADRLGNLLTAPVTGQSLAKWLGGATGYVTTWYNQIQPGQDVSATIAANQPTIDPVNKTIVFNGSTHSFSNTATTGGLLAACVGQGTKYTYTATWNKTGSSVARICEHEPLNTTTNQASGLSSLPTTYGFSGQNNDNTLIASFTAGTQVSTVMRLNNTAAPNLRVRSNGTDYSGSTVDYTTLSLNNYWFAIGRKASSNSEFFNGTMKNVMVFKDAISDADTAVLDAWQQTL